jgi:hypothetical protein
VIKGGWMTPFQQQIEDNRKLNDQVISELVSEGARLGAFAASAAKFAEAINADPGPQDLKARLLAPSEELLTAFEHFRDEIVAACNRLRKAIGWRFRSELLVSEQCAAR